MNAYATSLHPVFELAALLALAAFACTWFLQEQPLRADGERSDDRRLLRVTA